MPAHGRSIRLVWAVVAAVFSAASGCQGDGAFWTMHVIDNTSKGADGIRLADVNGDGLMDITTGWEEGGVTRVYLHPGYQKVKHPWPAVRVGRTPHVEDAVFVDLDGDGAVDVVSSCEGRTRSMFVHWAPKSKGKYLDAGAWTQEVLPASKDVMRWMFCLPLQVDGKNGIDLIAGGKDKGALIGWFEAPADPRKLAEWKWHPIIPVGWLMTMRAHDVDLDGDTDIVYSDKKGKKGKALQGVSWLENPGEGPDQTKPWKVHPINPTPHSAGDVIVADLDRDGHMDGLATNGDKLFYFRRLATKSPAWQTLPLPVAPDAGGGRALAVGDVDGDGKADIAYTSNARGEFYNVQWMAYRHKAVEADWEHKKISDQRGGKFDLVELIDLDGDGDLDVLTCEEWEGGLGVIWYENPTIKR